MQHEPLRVSPSGRLLVDTAAAAAVEDAAARKVLKAFASSPAEGLFALAGGSLSVNATATWVFWRSFGRRYLTELCHTPEAEFARKTAVEPPPVEQLEKMLASAPPMRGAEYLSADVLAKLWGEVDAWVCKQVESLPEGLSEFLKRHAPQWHQVGRVCFHLAENKQDEACPFAFLATYIPALSAQDRVRYQPLGKALQEYAGAHNKPALVRLLSPVYRVAETSAFIAALLESGDIFHPLAWTPREAYQFLQNVPACELGGVLVRLPNWWEKRPRPQAGLIIGQKRQPTLGAAAMLDFEVNMALGEERLTAKEWRELLAGDEGLVLFKGRWIEVDREKLTAALDHWKQVERAAKSGELTFTQGMRLLAGAPADLGNHSSSAPGAPTNGVAEWSFVRAGQWLGETLEKIRHPHSENGLATLSGLKASLRPYQRVGVQWLQLMADLRLGACLADDMGLGKTVQVLALLLLRKGQTKARPRPTLLVLPASLLSNWKAEIARFTPSLTALLVHPSEADKETLAACAADPEKALRGVDVVLTTYGMLQRHSWLAGVEWQLVVIDEAQAIKNSAARQTRAVKELKSQSRIALTGTPVENRLSDLWSLFDFLCPGLLGSATRFKEFVKALESREHERYTPLRNLVGPYILRRLKTDKSVIADLPDKAEVKAFCGLTKRQVGLYQKSVNELSQVLQGVEGAQRRGMVLAFLMRFKQICNHPSQLLGDGEYPLADSGKFARLVELCEEIASRQEKTLVFTQFREMTAPLAGLLSEVFQRPGLVLHGGTAVGKRKKLVDAFQREDGPPFFVLSLKAGGTGLNLTAASHVIHFDRWWNPAVENQATDRAFRIGQVRNVLVHKFVCRGTIEERIDQLIEEKQSLADEILARGGEQLLTEMSNEQLIELVSLDVNKATL